MDEKKNEIKCSHNERLQNVINNFSKCKNTFTNVSDECKKLREINTKLTTELKEAQDLEKSHRYHLITSREMIANLQETVSQLVYLKRDTKKLNDEIVSKDSVIDTLEKEKENVTKKQNDIIKELQAAHEMEITDIIHNNESKVQQIEIDSDTQIAQITCVAEELRSRIEEMEKEHKEKMNLTVLDYEEKIQRHSSQAAQLQEQLTRKTAWAHDNIEAYRRKLENLEEKLKQKQFKEYLTQNSSQHENKVERPYSVESGPYCSYPIVTNAMFETPTAQFPKPNHDKAPKQGTLQVMYSDGKPKDNGKKGTFNLTKKRKLYNVKDL